MAVIAVVEQRKVPTQRAGGGQSRTGEGGTKGAYRRAETTWMWRACVARASTSGCSSSW